MNTTITDHDRDLLLIVASTDPLKKKLTLRRRHTIVPQLATLLEDPDEIEEDRQAKSLPTFPTMPREVLPLPLPTYPIILTRASPRAASPRTQSLSIVPPLGGDNEALPSRVAASSTRWSTLYGFFRMKSPLCAANVLDSDPTHYWQAAHGPPVVLVFDFDTGGATPIMAMALQHTIPSARSDQAHMRMEIHANSQRLTQFEGLCSHNGWTILSWQTPVVSQQFTLKFIEADSTIALRRVRFLMRFYPKPWHKLHSAAFEGDTLAFW